MPPKKKASKNKGEEEKELPWGKHPAKLHLKKLFLDKTVPVDYSSKGGPRKVWDDHCKDHQAFVNMECNTTFTNRLRLVRNDYTKKHKRAEEDLKAYKNFRKVHPENTHNHKGEPRWEGSRAQELLRDDMDAGRPKENENPSDLWADRAEYQMFNLDTFQNHIHQEKRLRKCLNWLEMEEKKAAEPPIKKKRKKHDEESLHGGSSEEEEHDNNEEEA